MSIHTCSYYCDRPECIRAQRDELRQKLEQAEKQEPVACKHRFVQDEEAPLHFCCQLCGEIKTNTAPPKREWVWLTNQDYEEIMREKTYWDEVAKAVELKAKEKNGG